MTEIGKETVEGKTVGQGKMGKENGQGRDRKEQGIWEWKKDRDRDTLVDCNVFGQG
jgi:hypothetical protein